jgi:hypothetical protein
MLWIHEAANIPHVRTGYDVSRVEAWIAEDPTNHRWNDILLHWKYNTTNWVGSFSGWNPADDFDGSGCIDSTEGNNGLPTDPNRSAQCMTDARVLNAGGWRKAAVGSQSYIDFTAWEAAYLWDTFQNEGFHFDEAAYQSESLVLGNTFSYEGWIETDPAFPLIEEKIAFVPNVMALVEVHTGGPTIAIANMVSTAYICNPNDYHGPQHDYAQYYLENILLESWLPNLSHANTSRRERLLECPFVDFVEQGKGVIFTARDMPTERGKLFSLGMFYLINSQMAFYYYTTQGHSGIGAESGQWNPWVEYEVGQPMNNSFGYQDFQGNTGTNRFFVLESGSTYQILGREFLRSDSKKVLVLVKLMATGQTEGTGAALHSLPANYRKVLPDFTLGPVINQVTLVNNDAVILLRENPPGCKNCNPNG